MQPWTEEETRNLRLIGIDPIRTDRCKLNFLVRHFVADGSVYQVTEGRKANFNVSRKFAVKVRDLTKSGKLNWLIQNGVPVDSNTPPISSPKEKLDPSQEQEPQKVAPEEPAIRVASQLLKAHWKSVASLAASLVEIIRNLTFGEVLIGGLEEYLRPKMIEPMSDLFVHLEQEDPGWTAKVKAWFTAISQLAEIQKSLGKRIAMFQYKLAIIQCKQLIIWFVSEP